MNFENICTQKEADFLLQNLKPTDNVLEWGNGKLALQIADKVKHITVITHKMSDLSDTIDTQRQNMNTVFVPANETHPEGEDGNERQYHDYVNAAIEQINRFGKFSVIIIRGRARVYCAKICDKIGKDTTKVFIQDYNHPNKEYLRKEYFAAEEYLQPIESEFSTCLFKIKALNIKKDAPKAEKTAPKKAVETKPKETPKPEKKIPTPRQQQIGEKIAKQSKKAKK